MKHFTGIKLSKIKVIPLLCKETEGISYKPTRISILVGPSQLPEKLIRKLSSVVSIEYDFQQLSKLKGNLQEVVTYRAVLLIPNDVTSKEITQLYRLNMPLFVPSPKLLARWSLKYDL